MQDDERMVKADGLEDAIIGTGSRMNMPDVLVYSYNKCLKIFMERDGMTILSSSCIKKAPFLFVNLVY